MAAMMWVLQLEERWRRSKRCSQESIFSLPTLLGAETFSLEDFDRHRAQIQPLHTPSLPSAKVSVEALQWHADRCVWFKSPTASLG